MTMYLGSFHLSAPLALILYTKFYCTYYLTLFSVANYVNNEYRLCSDYDSNFLYILKTVIPIIGSQS